MALLSFCDRLLFYGWWQVWHVEAVHAVKAQERVFSPLTDAGSYSLKRFGWFREMCLGKELVSIADEFFQ